MKKFFKNSGFTLFELLAVLAILAIVAGIAVPRVMQTITNSRIQALEAEMQLVASAVQRMVMETEIMSSNNPNKGVNVPFYIAGAPITTTDDDLILDYLLDTTYTDGSMDADGIDIDMIQNQTDPSVSMNIEDYLEGGVPDYLYVFVYDSNELLDGTAETGTANILVVYDSDLNEDNLYGNVISSDLTFEDPLGIYSATPGDPSEGPANYVLTEVEYSGQNVDITSITP